MRRALRLIGWVGVGLALAVFFFVLSASLQVRKAVDEGALLQPVWSCISRPDADRLDRLPNRAFVRSIQMHLANAPANQASWHWNGLIAFIGTRTSFSDEEQDQAMQPVIASLPLCPERKAR